MIKKLGISILLVLSAWSISGCVPAVFMAGTGAGGAMVSDKRGMKTMIQDRDMANEALKRISANPQLKEGTHIAIAGFNHVLLMVGQASNNNLLATAYNTVRTVPNVKRIYNEVTIEPPTSMSVQANDSWITTKVKSALLMERGLASGQVKVVTENGVVYLLGIVTPGQSNLAANAASRVSDVKRVVKLFEYQQ